MLHGDAGAILVTLGDFLIILGMGMWAHDHLHTVDTAPYSTNNTHKAEPAFATTSV
jgi:hypothetical protein